MTKEEAYKVAEKKEGVIILLKEEDGNWRGYMNKYGKVIEERDYSPEIVLQKLLTHE